jgi:outer membrane receptor protein involved in Fe transport
LADPRAVFAGKKLLEVNLMRRVERPIARSGFPLSLGLLALASAPAGVAAELEEVVVTASRREQAVQDVAASVAVIDPQDFATGGLNSLADVLAYVPGVQVNDNGAPGQGSITMRGVANIFSTPTVGIYVDDIPYGSVTAFAEGANFALDSLLGDLERVEVIKGPQGTLFGASSMGGSLRYITRDPALDELRGHFDIDFSDTAEGGFNQLYKGAVSFPIVGEKLALSVSGFYQDSEGFIDDAGSGLDDVNDAELKGGNATLLYQASDAFSAKLNYMQQKFEFTNQNEVPFDITTGEPLIGRYEKSSADEPTEINYDLASATFEYQADWATVTLASSYQEFEQPAILDLTPFFGPLVDDILGVPVGTNQTLLDSIISTDRWAHELRLTSPNNQKLEWLAGVYYTSEESSNFQGVRVIPGPFDLVTQQFPSEYEEIAAFGNVTYYFTPKFDATVGMRFSSNDVSVTYSGTGLLAGPTIPKTTVSDDVDTYMFNARYRPSEDVSLYARIASGYRPVSPNLGLVDPSTGEILSVPFVESDSLWSYELGAKGDLAGGKVLYDVAVYHLKWKDLQVFRSFMGVNVGGNADSDVTANGVEATLTLQPTDSFDLVGAVNYASSELDDDDPAVGGLEGEQLPGIPEWTFSLNGNWSFPLGASVEGFVGGGVVYQDERKTSFIGGIGSDGTVITPTSPNFMVDDYVTVDLRLGAAFGRYQVALYANNLFNEYAFHTASSAFGLGSAAILRPRTIGATFSAEF